MGKIVDVAISSSPDSFSSSRFVFERFIRNCYRSEWWLTCAMFNQPVSIPVTIAKQNKTNHVSRVYVQKCTAFNTVYPCLPRCNVSVICCKMQAIDCFLSLLLLLFLSPSLLLHLRFHPHPPPGIITNHYSNHELFIYLIFVFCFCFCAVVVIVVVIFSRWNMSISSFHSPNDLF